MKSTAIISAAITDSKFDHCNSLFMGALAAKLHQLQLAKFTCMSDLQNSASSVHHVCSQTSALAPSMSLYTI